MSNKELANDMFESLMIWASTKDPMLKSDDVVFNIEKILDIVEAKCNETKFTKIAKYLSLG